MCIRDRDRTTHGLMSTVVTPYQDTMLITHAEQPEDPSSTPSQGEQGSSSQGSDYTGNTDSVKTGDVVPIAGIATVLAAAVSTVIVTRKKK